MRPIEHYCGSPLIRAGPRARAQRWWDGRQNRRDGMLHELPVRSRQFRSHPSYHPRGAGAQPGSTQKGADA